MPTLKGRRGAHPVNLEAGERLLGDVEPRGRLSEVVIHGDDAERELVIVPGSQRHPSVVVGPSTRYLKPRRFGLYRGTVRSYTRCRRRVSSRYISYVSHIASLAPPMLCSSSPASPTAALMFGLMTPERVQ